MNELLFGNLIEKEALENILALNQIKKCENEIEKYTNEIKEQNEKMINILKDENISVDYIEKIDKYRNLLINVDGETNRIDDLDSKISENEERINEFQAKISEVEETLDNLKKEIFETNDPSRVIECQNEIENNNVRLNDLNDILNQLISDNTPLLIEKEYLAAKNNDNDLNVPNFNKKDIKSELDMITEEFKAQINELELSVRENIEFCQKKISNRELEIQRFNERKKQISEAFPNALNLNIENAYTDLNNLLNELDLSRGSIKFDESDEIDTDNNENEIVPNEEPEDNSKEIKDEMSLISDTEDEEDFKFDSEDEKNVDFDNEEETNEENNTVESDEIKNEEVNDETEEAKVEESDEEIESVSYVLSEGESLENIAEKVYPSKDNWEAIYYFNKETIDKYLVSNGISNDFDNVKELSQDTSLFAGIKLEIPTDYNYKI